MATIKYWNGSAWELAIVGKQGPAGPTGPTGPAGQASLQRFRYVATGGQTSVSGTDANGNTLAYTPGLEEVFINGAAQVRGQDYTATNGTSITGISALIAGDVVEIYAWGVFNVANTIPNTLIDAKGDILAGTGADSVGRLAVGGNGQFLAANSSTSTGLEWVPAPSAGANWTLVNAGGTALTGAQTITVSGISNADKILVYVANASGTDASRLISIRLNGDTGGNYWQTGLSMNFASAYNRGNFGGDNLNGATSIRLGFLSDDAGSEVDGYALFSGCNSSGVKVFNLSGSGTAFVGNGHTAFVTGGFYNSSSTISSVSLTLSVGTFDAGTLFVYTSA